MTRTTTALLIGLTAGLLAFSCKPKPVTTLHDPGRANPGALLYQRHQAKAGKATQ